MIDGVEMDAERNIRAPDWATLDLYCDRVASAVGRLSVRIFGLGAQTGEALAFHLGRALQLTNILRDVDEDAAAGRLYLPYEALAAARVPVDDPLRAVNDPKLAIACDEVVRRARRHFEEAEPILASRAARRGESPAADGDGLSVAPRQYGGAGLRAPEGAGEAEQAARSGRAHLLRRPMREGTVHVIGAGLAGLSAAVRLTEAGVKTVVHEAAAAAGGRCKSFFDPAFGAEIDNGNHLILSGNQAALDYLARIGSFDRLSGPGARALRLRRSSNGRTLAAAPQ